MPQNKEKIKSGNLKKKFVLFFLIFCFVLFGIINFKIAEAGIDIGYIAGKSQGQDLNAIKVIENGIRNLLDAIKNQRRDIAGEEKKERKEKEATQSIWSKLFHSTLGTALNTLAFDTATWIGSGGDGQKPLFITEGWGQYLTNIADNAAGNFIEILNKEWGVNLCEPSLAVKTKISLGLIQYVRPEKPACTFSEMQKNWDKELQRKDFLSRFQNMFDPTSSDLGIQLSLFSSLTAKQQQDIDTGKLYRQEGGGWLDLRERISGLRKTYPGYAEEAIKEKSQTLTQNIAMYTGDALTDALNIFLNQLAITAFNNLMKNLAGDTTYTSPYDWDNLASFEAGPTSGGVAGAKEKLRQLIEPNFNIRGDYNILAELTQCPDPTKAGPTNCVITDKFSQAISEKITVGEAMKQGYLNANGIFGFTADGLEPAHNEGYPYRSMIILRKFRIVPVGWEIASQYIKTNPSDIDGTKNLGDLVACFDEDDDYNGYNDDGSKNWCEGLVDPTWVLKAPLNYCKREGPGPIILSEQVTGSGEESELSISRNDNYCADEQSCIKENDDGSCVAYGYCAEERRKWQFNGKSCEPKYNTCQTFRSSDGKTVSYLENTLDWSNCSADNAGCKWYCEDYSVESKGSYYIPSSSYIYFPFSGDIKDESGSGISASITGAPYLTTDRYGNVDSALYFDGGDDGDPDYITLNNTSSDNFLTGGFTLMAWVRYTAGDNSDTAFLGKHDSGWGNGYFLGANLGDLDYFTESDPRLRTANIYGDGEWHFVAGAYNGTNQYLYVDGVLINSQARSYVTGNNLNIGIGHGGSTVLVFFKGTIDEVLIYKYFLSQTEIEDYYKNAMTYMTNSHWTCSATSGNKLYLDNGAEECDASSEGCHEFLRTKPGTGANLLPNSSFEKIGASDMVDDSIADTFDFWGLIGEAVSGGYDGSTALKLTADFSQPIIIGPADYSVAGQTYTLSFYAKDCGASGQFGLDGNLSNLETSSDWQYFKLTNIYEESASGNSVNIKINGFGLLGCIIDAIKLEEGDGTSYDDYRGSGLVYEKLLPEYLASACYNNPGSGDYTFKSTAPSECSNFARLCGSSEAGCELYTSQTDGAAIPARVIAQDYCPAECVGYDVFIQKATVFDSLRDDYFIPQTAKSCSSEAVGCDEFTNLDEVARGGEGREDYTYLKQCIKPSTADCADFYTWEGSDETGYQLRTFSLKEDATDNSPYLTNPGAYNDQFCASAADYNLSTNPDCREFYTTGGDVFYKFIPYTVTCSDNCKPYRRTENNIEPSITDQASCNDGSGPTQLCNTNASDGLEYCWDASQNACYFCASGGKWDSGHFACLYDAIPGEGQTCSESQIGCREYTGNTGNNTMIILNSNFEGSTQGWIGINGTTANTNNTSLMAGGNSLFVSGGAFQASTTLGQLLSRGNSYVLSFLAKADLAAVNLTAEFDSGATTITFSGAASLTSSDWQIYKLNLAALDHVVTNSESLVITGDGDFYIDDIKLTEISDRYYLIKNSWQTPDSCFQDIYGNPVGALYNLGCDRYQDREGDTHYLHSFNKLCQESAVGCELVIDTYNSSDYQSVIWNDANTNGTCDTNEPDCVYTPEDNYTYAVYDQEKTCGAESKGCQRLGDYYKYGTDLAFSDVYLENNPDKYGESLCTAGAVGCEEWTTAEGASYFKDPGDQACEWRQEYGIAASSWAWYKKKVKKCDTDADGYGDGILCSADSDCASGETCKDTADTACPTSAFKTFGYGGTGNIVNQPTIDINNDYWAGICSASASGCGEYIDPVAKFSANLVFNADFSQDVDGDSIADGWSAAASGKQDIDIESNTLYILAVEDVNDAVLTIVSGAIYELDNNNNLISVSSLTVSSIAAGGRTSKIFYTSSGASGAVITVLDASAGNNSKVEVKKAIIDYELKGELDKTTCNGVVNFEDGCVLFNERAQSGSSLAPLSWDADLTVNDGAGLSPLAGAAAERDANTLLKVSPDRVCDKWLSCRSMVAMKKESGEEENVCFDIGLCDGVDDNGNCNNFVLEKKTAAGSPIEQTVSLPGGAAPYANAAGYVKIGLANIADNTMKGDFPLGAMPQKGELAYLPNGNFEIAGANGYPIGWVWEGGVWDASKFRIINNPYTAQVEGIGYAPEGRNFLKIGTAASSTSEFADVIGGIDYILTAYVNTINLAAGTAKVQLKQFDSNGLFISGADLISYSSGNDWGFQLAEFTTASNASRIKVVLYADSTTVGNFYFDDIKLRPALNSRTAWYTPQSCRLYPEQSSLACEYYDDSGIYRKGWHGYCLEYDRSPGSSDACVLWWPVDKVKGEGIEEGAGYLDKMPAYYCLEAKGYCSGTGNLEPKLYCSKVVQTVTSAGQNKFWSGRVYEGSSYEIPFANSTAGAYIDWGAANGGKENIIINYSRNDQPFGSLVPPSSENNPYEWDSIANSGTDLDIEPLYVGSPAKPLTGAQAGTPYYGADISCSITIAADSSHSAECPSGSTLTNCYGTGSGSNWGFSCSSTGCTTWEGPGNYGSPGCSIVCEEKLDYNIASSLSEGIGGVKRIFAQSYGAWEWQGDQNNGRYIVTSSLDWGPPTILCNGTGLAPRPAYPNDYCAILPVISNVKVNSENAADVILTKNQFINFTFNTEVDSQQMPMVMYAIDWGDNEKTVVSGVEMRAKPNADNPHSLYHLYSYWDLKGKAASGTYGVDHWIDCTTISGECKVKPKVQIKDNWGWCNGGSSMNDCDQWDSFSAWVVVKEK